MQLENSPIDGSYDLDFIKALERNFDKKYDPLYLSFDRGKIRRPVIKDKADKKKIQDTLQDLINDTFTGRIGVHWPFVGEVPVEFSIEPKINKNKQRPTNLGKGITELINNSNK